MEYQLTLGVFLKYTFIEHPIPCSLAKNGDARFSLLPGLQPRLEETTHKVCGIWREEEKCGPETQRIGNY